MVQVSLSLPCTAGRACGPLSSWRCPLCSTSPPSSSTAPASLTTASTLSSPPTSCMKPAGDTSSLSLSSFLFFLSPSHPCYCTRITAIAFCSPHVVTIVTLIFHCIKLGKPGSFNVSTLPALHYSPALFCSSPTSVLLGWVCFARTLFCNFSRSGADLASAFCALNMAVATWVSTNVSEGSMASHSHSPPLLFPFLVSPLPVRFLTFLFSVLLTSILRCLLTLLTSICTCDPN